MPRRLDLVGVAACSRHLLRGGRGRRRRGGGRVAVAVDQLHAELGDVAVVVREAPRDLHLRRDRAHDVGAGEERDLVDGVAIGRVAHRDGQVVLVVDRHRDRAQLDRHVRGDRGDDARGEPGERVRVDLRDEQALAVELGERVVVDGAREHEVLADRATGRLDVRTRVIEGAGRDQARAYEERACVVGHVRAKRDNPDPSGDDVDRLPAVSTHRRSYLDFNATAPVVPAVERAMAEAIAAGGNPSSIHHEGRAARDRVERARTQVAGLLARPREQVVLTSGGTEANVAGVRGLAARAAAAQAPAKVAWYGADRSSVAVWRRVRARGGRLGCARVRRRRRWPGAAARAGGGGVGGARLGQPRARRRAGRRGDRCVGPRGRCAGPRRCGAGGGQALARRARRRRRDRDLRAQARRPDRNRRARDRR